MFDRGFPYSCKLSAHGSCVNALAFSRLDARYMASGGDDLQIHLWDFHQENLEEPCHTFIGPRSNIFCFDFSCKNRSLFAGGVDFQVYRYDISGLGTSLTREDTTASSIYRERESIREISCHPFQDEIFLSASDSGRITQYDTRVKGATVSRLAPAALAQNMIQLAAECTGVQYHPQTENLFVTSDGHGNVCLRDARMGFGTRRERCGSGVVLEYNTKLARSDTTRMSNPEASSITFDAEGDILGVTMLHFYPTLYTLSDPNPVAVCTGRYLPEGTPVSEGERTYSNSCTMKHGSFGGPASRTETYYCAGSDDFCGYLWKIPPVEELIQRREVIPSDDWLLQDCRTIGFAESMTSLRYVPVDLSTPSAVLKGHDSIVNSTLIHPYFPLVVTAGVERDIRLHNPTKSAPFSQEMELSPVRARQLSDSSTAAEARVINALLLGGIDPVDADDSERDTIRLFDRILRMEGEADPFVVRSWVPDDENDDDDDVEDRCQ
ncbi:wd repeat domain 22 [Moniliophthora roreri MCA 2997]|uniref:Wd repeat domain 22 n=2 Tax=Moniliophthora roreri TaxID=221103 RepID=V2XQT5_MONRO|nr:wd repeat domain 22 [Moniliophthora roreri MCA 2997]